MKPAGTGVLTFGHNPPHYFFAMSFRRIICMLLLCLPLLAAEFRGVVVSVHDGDTITVLDQQKVQRKIRLDAIDAPETGQAYGTQSKKYLSTLVASRSVRIVFNEKDRYGRILGTVYVGGTNVNLKVVEAGYAWHYVSFAKDKLEYAAAEASARKARRGLWADSQQPIPPWEFRKTKKSNQINTGRIIDVSH